MAPTRLYFIAYDVSSPKRWRRVYKTIRQHGAWQQFSAFVCRLTPRAREGLEAELRRQMDAASDRLMIVDLGSGPEAEERLRRFGDMPGLPAPRARIF